MNAIRKVVGAPDKPEGYVIEAVDGKWRRKVPWTKEG